MSATYKKTVPELHDMAEEAFRRVSQSKEAFVQCLLVTSMLHGLDFMNQLLVFLQKPDAAELGGKRSWSARKRPVKDGEEPVWLILPTIHYRQGSAAVSRTPDGKVRYDGRNRMCFDKKPDYEIGEQVIPVYDISQTRGDQMPAIRHPEQIERGMRMGGFQIIHVERDSISEEGKDGYVAGGRICVAGDIASEKRRYSMELLRLMVESEKEDIAASEKNLSEDGLKVLAAMLYHCLSAYFFEGQKGSGMGIIFQRYARLGETEKKQVYRALTRWYRSNLHDIIGQELSFTGTAIINGLLDTGYLPDMENTLDHALDAVPHDSEMAYEIKNLSRQLTSANEGFLEELYHRKLYEKVIYTSPPVKIPTRA